MDKFLFAPRHDTSVCIVTGYGLDERGVGVLVAVESRLFSFPRRPDWLWGPPNLLFKGDTGGKAAGA
jgi:hypothetical protein